jgi:putative transposase
MTAPFKDRLHHQVPAWVPSGSTFHLRIRCERAQLTRASLISPKLAPALLESARFYHTSHRWCCFLFLLMPDHLHALIAFPRQESMSAVLHDWKGWHKRTHDVEWQDSYFDHRIRNDHEFELKADYIRQNPVVKQLCARAEDWPWFCEPLAEEVGGRVPAPAFETLIRDSKHAGTGTCPPTQLS